MEDILDATLYQDDFLERTLNASKLYDKSNLDLTFDVTNGNTESKNSQNVDNASPDSPNLDFLKFGSPDLEQMFLSMDTNEETSISSENNDDANSTTFDVDKDLVNAENCFTEALQVLHDKAESLPVDLLDITFKHDNGNDVLNSNKEYKQHDTQLNEIVKSKNHYHQHATNLNQLRQQMHHNDMLNNNQHLTTKTLHHQEPSLISHPQPQQQHSLPGITADIVLPEQIAINNQIALINSMNHSMNVHQLHQQQQEIAFLTQSMGFQAERENLQPHMNMNGTYQPHVNQMAHHSQQKYIEQQMLRQQINGVYHGAETNPHMQNMQQIDSLAIDEQTLKLFVENPHLAPMNLDIQELIKRERKKLRNRIASSKCRKRKLEREGRLEDKVKTLKEKNIELNAVANALKQQICDLKQRVMDHVGEGCQIVLPS